MLSPPPSPSYPPSPSSSSSKKQSETTGRLKKLRWIIIQNWISRPKDPFQEFQAVGSMLKQYSKAYDTILLFLPGFNTSEMEYKELNLCLAAVNPPSRMQCLNFAATYPKEFKQVRTKDTGEQSKGSGGKPSKSKMYGITEVTLASFAWSLCCVGTFNIEEFFNMIVETLSDGDDEWAVETLTWLTEQIYGKKAQDVSPNLLDETDSDLAKMRARCVA
ncbi:hypothetical protein SERLADRAFT_409087 [Serpula lacrymans var. lacrymans S7.9]|uniref:Uncharacterized protein n=1 Tax=Serpula lacrymans var. lacrymans (strain S7.9) TaxID=578457 RepID=F8NZ12_SERL9|nr:uncharacterized protein SERLADRAFT_409087 [Serpula lacrymans var. lacrymans S7.9]EGO23832.1 hypothetical protein SERLADRAFT_409087 [Serpula lacrymans var. lacrymans S7.9]